MSERRSATAGHWSVPTNWASAGRAYERYSAHFGDAIERCVDRLAPKPGERMLDVAAGTGWGTRRAVRSGATLFAMDFGAELIDAARRLAAEAGVAIEFAVADAQSLPYPDASFDVVMSTFGVIFVHDPQAAARELSRVCRPGGRLGLTAWTPESTMARLFHEVTARYRPPATGPKPPSQYEWGRPARVAELLGDAFDLAFDTERTMLTAPDGAAVWKIWSQSHGPTMAALAALDPERQERFRNDFITYHEAYRTPTGIAMPREYLLTHGIRR